MIFLTWSLIGKGKPWPVEKLQSRSSSPIRSSAWATEKPQGRGRPSSKAAKTEALLGSTLAGHLNPAHCAAGKAGLGWAGPPWARVQKGSWVWGCKAVMLRFKLQLSGDNGPPLSSRTRPLIGRLVFLWVCLQEERGPWMGLGSQQPFFKGLVRWDSMLQAWHVLNCPIKSSAPPGLALWSGQPLGGQPHLSTGNMMTLAAWYGKEASKGRFGPPPPRPLEDTPFHMHLC